MHFHPQILHELLRFASCESGLFSPLVEKDGKIIGRAFWHGVSVEALRPGEMHGVMIPSLVSHPHLAEFDFRNDKFITFPNHIIMSVDKHAMDAFPSGIELRGKRHRS